MAGKQKIYRLLKFNNLLGVFYTKKVYISVKRGDDLNTLILNNQSSTCISEHQEDKHLKKEILIYVRETGKLEVELVQPAIKRALKVCNKIINNCFTLF